MKRIWWRFRNFFRGPIGYQGPAGDPGEPGWLEIIDFLPGAREIALYDDRGNLLWQGKLKKVKR